MKAILLYLMSISLAVAAEDSGRFQNMVRLKEAEAALLKLETAEAEETAFEETVFALGEIEVLAGKRTVASVKIAPGQPVTPDDVLVEIVNLEVVEAAAQVPQHLAGALATGQSARIRVAAYPDKVFEAKLAHLATEADAGNGTLEAAFHVENPDKLLRPGMKAEFTIVTGRREGVLAVPRSAVLGESGRRFVMVKDYELEHAFLKTGIVTGAVNDGFVEVVSGLFPGDEVVTRGAWNLASATSSVSLREAMDAAHGHPHNEDGSEMTKEQFAAAEEMQEGGREGGRGSMWSPLAVFFAGTSGVLLVLLALVSLRRKGGTQ